VIGVWTCRAVDVAGEGRCCDEPRGAARQSDVTH